MTGWHSMKAMSSVKVCHSWAYFVCAFLRLLLNAYQTAKPNLQALRCKNSLVEACGDEWLIKLATSVQIPIVVDVDACNTTEIVVQSWSVCAKVLCKASRSVCMCVCMCVHVCAKPMMWQARAEYSSYIYVLTICLSKKSRALIILPCCAPFTKCIV